MLAPSAPALAPEIDEGWGDEPSDLELSLAPRIRSSLPPPPSEERPARAPAAASEAELGAAAAAEVASTAAEHAAVGAPGATTAAAAEFAAAAAVASAVEASAAAVEPTKQRKSQRWRGRKSKTAEPQAEGDAPGEPAPGEAGESSPAKTGARRRKKR